MSKRQKTQARKSGENAVQKDELNAEGKKVSSKNVLGNNWMKNEAKMSEKCFFMCDVVFGGFGGA